jgi:hypothetical protein
MVTRSFPGVKRPGRGADHPPPSSAEVKKEYSYTSTPSGPLGLLWGNFYSHKLDENKAMVTKADKEKAMVILYQQEYDEKSIDFINNFSTLNKNPTTTFQEYISVTSHHHTTQHKDTKEYPAEIYNF